MKILHNFAEHVVSIIASMLRNCKGQQRQRLLSKFTENDYEKVDRLMELHFKYLEKVEEVEKNGKVNTHNQSNQKYISNSKKWKIYLLLFIIRRMKMKKNPI